MTTGQALLNLGFSLSGYHAWMGWPADSVCGDRIVKVFGKLKELIDLMPDVVGVRRSAMIEYAVYQADVIANG